jgi:tRNA pseudouridine38-40 synthase
MGVLKIVLRYDGRAYFGWQRHGERPTVQRAVETALCEAIGVPCRVQGAGRTDRGAHALGQVVSVRVDAATDPAALPDRLNALLPADIRVLSAEVAADDFHSRESATGKVYRYEIWNARQCPDDEVGRVWHVPGRIDADAMREASAVLVGEHDFASFATRPNFRQKSTRRHLRRLTLTQDRPRISIVFVADGFLYKMVRNMVRGLVRVGEGRWSADDLARALAARDRSAAPGAAPASGLYLDAVLYGDKP